MKIWSPWIFAFLLLSVSHQVSATGVDWLLFKQRFLQVDGRVVDTGNAGVSHTEGQGVAMLLATRYEDKVAFDSIWQWTKNNLQVRADKLFAWRWVQGVGVADKNNASDGDLFIAWALVRAHKKWGKAVYLAQAKEIIQAFRTHLLFKTNRGLVMLPGTNGFDKTDSLVLNLSYWVYPALNEIAQVDPATEWQELTQTGLDLLGEAHFGRWGLPPDWLQMGDKLAPATTFRFGYDAIRIPLYLFWAALETNDLLAPYRSYWSYFNGNSFLPAWTDLTNDSIDSYDASQGLRQLSRVVIAYPHSAKLSLPALDSSQDYYSSILLLMVKMAIMERKK